jgi:hypothetical protein
VRLRAFGSAPRFTAHPILCLIALLLAADAEIPHELGLGAGLEYSSNSTRILNSSESDDWSSFTSQGLMAATSVRFRWLKKGFTVDPVVGCALSSGQHHTKKRADPSKSQLLDCSAAMMLRPRLAVRETLELYAIAGLGYTRPALDAAGGGRGRDHVDREHRLPQPGDQCTEVVEQRLEPQRRSGQPGGRLSGQSLPPERGGEPRD